MTEQRFASWVQPVADSMRRTRAEIVELARSLPVDAWGRPSPNAGWTYGDLLAHIADDTGKNLHDALAAVATGQDIPAELFEDIDARNARGVADRHVRSIDELIGEIERDGERLQHLLTKVREEDESRTQPQFRGTLGNLLRGGLAGHDAFHLGQLRTALGVVGARS